MSHIKQLSGCHNRELKGFNTKTRVSVLTTVGLAIVQALPNYRARFSNPMSYQRTSHQLVHSAHTQRVGEFITVITLSIDVEPVQL